MRNKGNLIIKAYRYDLHRNLEYFERALERSIRSIANYHARVAAEKDLDSFIDECKKNENRVPNALSPILATLQDAQKDLEKHLQKQSEIDLKMIDELKPLRETYIMRLEVKRKALIKDHDDVAAAQIAEETELTRKSENHFQKVME